MTSSFTPMPLVRISYIGSRYLIFDYQDISRLRRDYNLCAILVGTTPQNPSQNIFQGVPLEVGPEEASGLVAVGAARIVDELQAHIEALVDLNTANHDQYLDDLKSRRRQFAEALGQDEKRKKQESRLYWKNTVNVKSLLNAQISDEQSLNYHTAAFTPAHSLSLVSERVNLSVQHHPVVDPLWRWLQWNSFYMTPGLRFGSHYSVYPGDPLRYHAHFLANSYSWDKPIPLLDLVSNGRLGTAVKKGYLIGSQPIDDNNHETGPFRAFTIEWAAM